MKTYDRCPPGRLRCTEWNSVGTLDMLRVLVTDWMMGESLVQSELSKGLVLYEGQSLGRTYRAGV